jgi:hypothetical protein
VSQHGQYYWAIAMMVQAEAILIDDENVATVQALEGRCPKLAVLSDDALRALRRVTYVTLDHAADLIGTAAVVLDGPLRSGKLAVITHGGQTYVSLQSALDYRDRTETLFDAGLKELCRVTQEAGLYDIELELYK